MIFKCGECSHLFEIADPAIGWESSLNVAACPNGGMPIRKLLGEARLIGTLLAIQFLSAATLAGKYLLGSDHAVGLYVAGWLVSSFWLLTMNNRKGYPLLLRRRKSAAITE